MSEAQIVRVTAKHLFNLYRMQFARIESQEEAVASAGAAVFNYLFECGIEGEAAVRMRDELMLSAPPLDLKN